MHRKALLNTLSANEARWYESVINQITLDSIEGRVSEAKLKAGIVNEWEQKKWKSYALNLRNNKTNN